MDVKSPAFITLTGGTCSGKSHLLNYIREQGYPCIVSTTTRAPRVGETEGVDYYFISKEESEEIQRRDGFAEFVEYNVSRYGVTHEEFESKLALELPVFLIVEPTGIDNYIQPALRAGVPHFSVFVSSSIPTQIARFKKRFSDDVYNSSMFVPEMLDKVVDFGVDRLAKMLTTELDWEFTHKWDLYVDGEKDPSDNLSDILRLI